MAMTIIRITIGVIFISHGLARFYYQSIPGFGQFLSSSGLPFGLALAWMVTIGEIISGSLLVLGKFVRYCCIFHALVICGGIAMVHLSKGWFVVGHGSGGIEYSVLILAVLFLLFRESEKSI